MVNVAYEGSVCFSAHRSVSVCEELGLRVWERVKERDHWEVKETREIYETKTSRTREAENESSSNKVKIRPSSSATQNWTCQFVLGDHDTQTLPGKSAFTQFYTLKLINKAPFLSCQMCFPTLYTKRITLRFGLPPLIRRYMQDFVILNKSNLSVHR